MRRRELIMVIGLVLSWLVGVSQASAISLEEAKAKGLLGEKLNGYLGIINAGNPEVQALANDVNQKRRQAYEDIARRDGTTLDVVESLAGEKAVQKTRPGNYVEGAGGWMKK